MSQSKGGMSRVREKKYKGKSQSNDEFAGFNLQSEIRNPQFQMEERK